jgi:uncharacterized repeat protein (TIGR02543 family)
MPNFYWNYDDKGTPSTSDDTGSLAAGPFRTTTFTTDANDRTNTVALPNSNSGYRHGSGAGTVDSSAAISITKARMYLAGYGAARTAQIKVGNQQTDDIDLESKPTTLVETRAQDTGLLSLLNPLAVGAGTSRSATMGFSTNGGTFFGRHGSTADATTLWGQCEYIETPSAPTGLSTSGATSSSFTVTWSAPSNNGGSSITAYILHISTSSNFSTFTPYTYTTVGTRSYEFTGLDSSTTYYVRIFAGNIIYDNFASKTSSSASLSAQATTLAGTYTVTLDANGGSVTTSSYEVTPGGSVSLNSPSWSGKTFTGWYTSSTYGEGNFASSFYTPTASVTLYARWEYAVQFDANNGTNGGTTYVGVNSSGTAVSNVTSPSSTRTGYTFLGWYNSSGNLAYNANSVFAPTANVTYYAYWRGTVSFDVRSGTSVSVITYTDGNSIILPNTTRSGYTFGGWETNTGTFIGNAGSSVSPTTSPLTYYARWSALAVSWSDASLSLSARKGQPYSTVNNSVTASYVNSWIVSGVPGGLTFNQQINATGSATSTLTGSPTVYGPYTMTLTPRNVDNVSGDTYTYEIQIADVALSWTGGNQFLASSTAVEGVLYEDGVSVAMGPVAPTVTYSEKVANSLPPGLTVNSTTGEITGVPTDPGTYEFVIRATNGTEEILETTTLTITVEAAGGYVQVKTSSGWVDATVFVKTNDGWTQGTVNAKSSSGWGPSFSS